MKKGDILLFLCIIVLSIACIFVFYTLKPDGKTVVIKQNNSIYGEYPLNTDTEIVLPHNTVTVNDGEVYISFAECPDKVCFKHAPINKSGETIICLPNKVIIEIQ